MGIQNNMVPYDRRCARSRSRSPTTLPKPKMDNPVSSWKLGEQIQGENGLRFASLTMEGEPITLTISGVAPFEPSSWGDSPVKNLDIRLDGPTEEKMTCMQACIAERFSLPKYQENVFKKFLSKNMDFPANVRFKLGLGLTGTRYWNKDKKLIKMPDSFQGATFDVKLIMKGVWYSYDCWGVSLHATDILLTKEAPIPNCPF